MRVYGPHTTIGTDYVLISYSNSHLLIKVAVHQDIKISNDSYVIFSGNKRMTMYSSIENDIENENNNKFFYYIPTIYAVFNDDSFGDISNHPFLIYTETELNQSPTTTSNQRLVFEKSNNLYTGRIYCKAKVEYAFTSTNGFWDSRNNKLFYTRKDREYSNIYKKIHLILIIKKKWFRSSVTILIK